LKLSATRGVWRAARLAIITLVWLAAWALFARTVRHGDTSHAYQTWGGAGMLIGANISLLLILLVNPEFGELPAWEIGAGFVMTFSALIGAYAAADFASSHSYAFIQGHIHDGKHIAGYLADGKGGHHRILRDCYRDNGARMPHGLSPWNAIYAALGTVTTAGSGEITAHSALCRKVTSLELAFSFPVLGLAVAGAAVRLFKIFSPQERADWRTVTRARRLRRRAQLRAAPRRALEELKAGGRAARNLPRRLWEGLRPLRLKLAEMLEAPDRAESSRESPPPTGDPGTTGEAGGLPPPAPSNLDPPREGDGSGS
jgi:Ion channel